MVDTTNHPPVGKMDCPCCDAMGEHYSVPCAPFYESKSFDCDECKGTGFVDDPDYCTDEEWYCPNCGEIGGEPRTVTSSEFQGDEAHGGVVTWDDEVCSLCIVVRV